VAYCKKRHCLEAIRVFNSCTCERPQYSHDLIRAKMQLAVTLVVMDSETDSVKFARCKFIVLENYIFRQISAKFLQKTKSSTIVETYFYDGQFCKRLSSTISEQDFNQNIREVLT